MATGLAIGVATVLRDLLQIAALIARLLQISIFYPMAVSLEVGPLDIYLFCDYLALILLKTASRPSHYTVLRDDIFSHNPDA